MCNNFYYYTNSYVLFCFYYYFILFFILRQLRNMLINNRKSSLKNVNVIKRCTDILQTVDNYILRTTTLSVSIVELNLIFDNCVLLEKAFKENVIAHCNSPGRRQENDSEPITTKFLKFLQLYMCFKTN